MKLVTVPCSLEFGDAVSELSVELGREALDELGVAGLDGMELLVRRPDGETVPP